MKSWIAAPFAAIFLMATGPATASADAQLTASVPATGSVVTVAPPEVVLTFDDPLLATTSSFDVVDTSGATVATGSVDTTDAHRMRGPASTLANGLHEVRWTAAAADGHIQRGTFRFTIAAAPPSASSTRAADPSSSGNATTTDVIVPIAAAIIITSGGLVWFLRRRTPAA